MKNLLTMNAQDLIIEHGCKEVTSGPVRTDTKEFGHYHKDVRHLDSIDVYRVLELFDVTDPAVQHAVKKLLVSGKRGAKDKATDYREAKVSIERAIEMQAEDKGRAKAKTADKYVALEFEEVGSLTPQIPGVRSTRDARTLAPGESVRLTRAHITSSDAVRVQFRLGFELRRVLIDGAKDYPEREPSDRSGASHAVRVELDHATVYASYRRIGHDLVLNLNCPVLYIQK